MKKLLLLIGVSAAITACSEHKTQRNAYAKGIYSGITPCADCEGIETFLTLEDSTYTLETKYLDKSDTVFEVAGKYVWNDEKTKITLDNEKLNGFNTQFLVGDSTLTQLDENGNVIDSEFAKMYVLHKQ